MNVVVMQLTLRSLIGRRRAWVLLMLPVLLLGLAVLVRVMVGMEETVATAVVLGFGVGTVVPLLGLIAGTGAIGPEIGDGSIAYILAKPIKRRTIIMSKLVVAVGVAAAFGTLPIYVAAWIITGSPGTSAAAPAIGALAAVIAYCALFQLLAIVTRNAAIIGLVYALVWETIVGQFIPGARALSVQQWSLAITDRLLDGSYDYVDIDPAVELSTGIIMLVTVTVVATLIGSRRLWNVHLSRDE